MIMKRIIGKLFIAVVLAVLPGACSPSCEEDREMDRFITGLMERMTLREKLGQLNLPSGGDLVTGSVMNAELEDMIRMQEIGGFFNVKGAEKIAALQRVAVEETRLKIPLLVGADVIHGYETIFPIPLALSCSWDTLAVERMARISAIEASANGINWTFSPMVDICRDARWGRIAEGSGEDPYLGSAFARAYVRGYQGDDMKGKDEILSCVKHFALYGASESGRDYHTVDMSRLRMYNEYLAPYKAAIDAGAGSVMSSFNIVDGIPAVANRWLLTDLLRKEWGFGGLLVSDYNSIGQMEPQGIAPLKDASARALSAGTDMDMVSGGFLNTLEESIKEGKVTERQVDAACRRVLEAKYRLGLFSDPYKYSDTGRAAKVTYTQEHRSAARDIAAETFVLLKNTDGLLPLKKKGRIALIGPMADARNNMCGMWSMTCTPSRHGSLLEGLRSAVGDNAEILYAKGSNVYYDAGTETPASGIRPLERGNNRQLLDEALRTAARADVIVAAVGECAEMSGESASRTGLGIPDAQRDLLKALVKTGKPVVLVLFTGRPLVLNWENENIPAILNVWYGGSETGDAIADVLFGKVSPSGKLTTTFPRSVGQLPLYYNYLNSGHPDPDSSVFNRYSSNYIDESNEPLYPFGYGLSYTNFTYGDMRLSSDTISEGGELTVSVTVANSGEYDGYEIVQMYLHDVYADVSRPVKELKGFERVFLRKGESREIEFVITENDLKFYNSELNHVYEPGEFEVMVGPDSRNVQTRRFSVGGTSDIKPLSSHKFEVGTGTFLMDGKPYVVKAAELHYTRIPRDYWEHRIEMCKALGMNTICMYIFWNIHEQKEGRFDFSGQNDIAEFCRLAQKHGMYVIVRPGPYVCAEWEMGGLPWWLLKKKDVALRTLDPYYMERVGIFMKEVGKQLAPLQLSRGGNIIMVQVENEYGAYATDKPYVSAVRDIVRSSGFTDVPLFQCDWSSNFTDNLLWTLNFGTGADVGQQFMKLKEVRPETPLMCSEFWSGWFDHWGRSHETRPAGDMVQGIRDMLDRNISFSLYMTHGGTTFGHWGGANNPAFSAMCSSYDYDAPISEAGWTTEKYFMLRDLLKTYLPEGETLPEPPAALPVIGIPEFHFTEISPLFTNLPKRKQTEDIQPMEQFDQGWGTILYRTTLPEAVPAGTVLEITEVHDWAQVFVDGKLLARLDRRKAESTVVLPALSSGTQLDILVEAMGRVNFDRSIHDHKGITEKVELVSDERREVLKNWSVYNFPSDYKSAGNRRYREIESIPAETPAYYRASFKIDEAGDTFLDMSTWGKGMVWVNGHALGRFWEIGPQQTLFLPGCWLRKGENEIIVLDLKGPSSLAVRGLEKPVLDKLREDAPKIHRKEGEILDLSGEDIVSEGAFAYDSGWQEVRFADSAEGRFLCLEAVSSQTGDKTAAIAELEILGADGKPVPREHWKILYADSEDVLSGNHTADKVFDLQESTFWMSTDGVDFPHSLVIDLGEIATVTGLRYLPRAENGCPGLIRGYRVYVKPDGFRY